MYKKAILGLLALGTMACNSTKKISDKKQSAEPAVLSVFIKDSLAKLDSVYIFGWDAIQAKKMVSIPIIKTATGLKASCKIDSLDEGMYFVGASLADIKPLLLGANEAVTISNSKLNFSEANISKSALNQDFITVHDILRKRSATFNELAQEYNRSNKDQVRRIELTNALKEIDKKRVAYHDSLKQASPMLARFAAFHTYPSYQNNKIGKETEGEYYARTFFNAVDVRDTVYSKLPIFYENIKQYAIGLTQAGLTRDQQRLHLDSLLNKIGTNSPNYKSALMGVTLAMMGKKNNLFITYAKNYLELFRGQDTVIEGFFDKELDKFKGRVIEGQPAPDLIGKNPEGKEIKLSDYKGKYVLVDFWASWCGPCRRDNPHVVKLYDKYKDEGFEILGVSLDNNKVRWEKAIKDDKLVWAQISDLKGWSSELSKLYNVRGIPYTVLVNPKGEIEALRLRGAALDARLKLIYGK